MQAAFDRQPSPALELLYREVGHTCHGCGNVVIVVSVDEPDSAYMERNAVAMRQRALGA